MAENRRISVLRPSQIFDSFMDEIFNTSGVSKFVNAGVDIDMFEDDNNVVVKAKTPGYSKENIDISIEDFVLTISGASKKEEEKEDDKKKYYYKEISEESFSRSVSLPSKVDTEKAEASFQDGILTITLPKLPESKPKKVKVN